MNKQADIVAGRGLFITFEGGEGSGKSTQIKLLADAFRKTGKDVLVTREPGGPAGAEAVRHVLLSGAAEPLGPEMEAILFSAARSDNVEQVVRPALESGTIVLSDRFFDSTRVYQGATGGVDMDFLHALERAACEDCWPNLTIILDLDPAEGMKRAASRRKADQAADRFEKEELALQETRRQAYLDIAEEEPERCLVIDAGASATQVHKAIVEAVNKRLGVKLAPAARRPRVSVVVKAEPVKKVSARTHKPRTKGAVE